MQERSRRKKRTALAFTFLLACGTGGAAVGVSEPRAHAPSVMDDAGSHQVHLGRLEGFERVTARTPSRGHYLGAIDVEILADEKAREGLRGGTFAEGARFLAIHYPGNEREAPIVFSSVRSADDGGTKWEFTVDGSKAGNRCEQCHQEAERDFVFTRIGTQGSDAAK